MDFTRVAPYLTDPYILVGFSMLLSAGFAKTLIAKGIIPPLTKGAGSQVVKLILILGFVLPFILVIFGSFYKYKKLEYSHQALPPTPPTTVSTNTLKTDLARFVDINAKKFELQYPDFNNLWKESVTVNVIIEYPQISGLPNKQVERKINDQIIEWAGVNSSHMSEHLDHVANYEVVYIKDNTLSLIMEDGGIYVGAATSVSTVKTLVFNLENGERFELKDLFRSGYQKSLLSLVKQRAYCDAEKVQMGEPTEIKDNQEFFIKDGVVTLIYQRRDICAGAYGPTYVSVEPSALRSLLNPNGPLGYLL
ncbi:DUF3298 and DUF4163 domain-containing protein [Janthinobacterium sp. EB271-G4-7A]|uniref:DUF3298 and DUF4163 domain-containing protein n=1 Tax=Janthinobacterium sp. EB271-G4-7A TaxID=2775056 RepID=UPI001E342F2E|nr:DUF3298 and DUF4163 domain-containing protein [Janthinobacterium sp. EB271-G4-7A]MCC7700357.1 hypothetical protein [Janthinobacterium sp. EB271-G4-7A]